MYRSHYCNILTKHSESTESVLPQPGAVSGGRGGSIAGITVGVLVLILVAAAALVVAVIMLALYYGYKHPTSRIGTLMTKVNMICEIKCRLTGRLTVVIGVTRNQAASCGYVSVKY